MIFFSGDKHLEHANIIKYCKRPFTDIHEMTRTIIERHNSVVMPDDTIYELGDVAFCHPDRAVQLLRRMNGHKHLIVGNHDEKLLRDEEFRRCFESIEKLSEIDVPDDRHKKGRRKIVLCHYSMRVWNRSHRGAWHLYGHSHGTLPDLGLSFDVGVDKNDFYPWSLNAVGAKMASKTFVSIDHHRTSDHGDL